MKDETRKHLEHAHNAELLDYRSKRQKRRDAERKRRRLLAKRPATAKQSDAERYRAQRRGELDRRKGVKVVATLTPLRKHSMKPQKLAKCADQHVKTVVTWLGDDEVSVAKLLAMPKKHRRREATRIVNVVLPQLEAAKAAGKATAITVASGTNIDPTVSGMPVLGANNETTVPPTRSVR